MESPARAMGGGKPAGYSSEDVRMPRDYPSPPIPVCAGRQESRMGPACNFPHQIHEFRHADAETTYAARFADIVIGNVPQYADILELRLQADGIIDPEASLR
jgi:hypothetical protein